MQESDFVIYLVIIVATQNMIKASMGCYFAAFVSYVH